MANKPSAEELKKNLSEMQFYVTQNHGTEPPFTGRLLHNKRDGVYHCLICDAPLFHSQTKYDSGCGWPSFYEPVSEESIRYIKDLSHGMQRIEIRCGNCDAHLGHVFEGERFTIEGQIRSFNNREPTGRRLILCVYALSMTTTDAPMQNEAVLTGTVCKPPVYRQTPLGRQITDLCLAVPRLYRRTDYIPCILWGRTALAAAEYPTGTELTLTGRLQSRTYLKNLGETSETRTAYEFSVSACERVPELAIF